MRSDGLVVTKKVARGHEMAYTPRGGSVDNVPKSHNKARRQLLWFVSCLAAHDKC